MMVKIFYKTAEKLWLLNIWRFFQRVRKRWWKNSFRFLIYKVKTHKSIIKIRNNATGKKLESIIQKDGEKPTILSLSFVD